MFNALGPNNLPPIFRRSSISTATLFKLKQGLVTKHPSSIRTQKKNGSEHACSRGVMYSKMVYSSGKVLQISRLKLPISTRSRYNIVSSHPSDVSRHTAAPSSRGNEIPKDKAFAGQICFCRGHTLCQSPTPGPGARDHHLHTPECKVSRKDSTVLWRCRLLLRSSQRTRTGTDTRARASLAHHGRAWHAFPSFGFVSAAKLVRESANHWREAILDFDFHYFSWTLLRQCDFGIYCRNSLETSVHFRTRTHRHRLRPLTI